VSERRKRKAVPRGRPRIGVAGGNAAQLKNYLDAVEAAGGEAVPLLPGAGSPPEASLDDLDGLVLTGGKDIDPALYGQRLQEGCAVEIDPPRDALEIPLARRALERDLPVLGICRGVQVLNVAAGGTLHQDITLVGLRPGSHNQREASPQPSEDAAVHDVMIGSGSRLAGILGGGRLGVNSFHHQVIDRPAPQFAVVARSIEREGSGVIEAVEAQGRSFAVGVEWHPERMWRRVPACARLFSALVSAAARVHAARKKVG
jgi:putative glutamine amidotransferase